MLHRTAACLGLGLTPALRGIDPPGAPGPTARPGFKIGAVDWELTKAADPAALLTAARLGFDGLQVDLGDVASMRNPDRQKQYQTLAREHGIEIASLALGSLSDAPYAKDPKGQAQVDAAIDIARAMNQRILLLAFFGKNDFSAPENTLDALVGRLKENAPKAEKAGVVLGLEGETSVERYREMVDRVGSPAVRVYFDCVHAHGAGRDIYQEITLLGDRICEFHAKDYGNILFGQGKVDWHQVRRAMDAIGYRGWIQVEQWGEISGDKPLGFEETHRRNLRYLREMFPLSKPGRLA
jgi:L-ribulose-5-phosphate 3-epimerase